MWSVGSICSPQEIITAYGARHGLKSPRFHPKPSNPRWLPLLILFRLRSSFFSSLPSSLLLISANFAAHDAVCSVSFSEFTLLSSSPAFLHTSRKLALLLLQELRPLTSSSLPPPSPILFIRFFLHFNCGGGQGDTLLLARLPLT